MSASFSVNEVQLSEKFIEAYDASVELVRDVYDVQCTCTFTRRD